MRVALLLSDVSYPPREGLHQQSILLAQALRGAEHQVTIFTYGRSSHLDHAALAADLNVTVRLPSDRVRHGSLFGAGMSLIPGTKAHRAQREFAQGILNSDFDAIHIEGALASMLPRRSVKATRAVMSWVDLGSSRYQNLASGESRVPRFKATIASLAYRALEARAARIFTDWHFVSDVDAAIVRKRSPKIRVHVIPPMVPREFFEVQPTTTPMRVVVFADLRQPYLKAAFEHFMPHVFQSLDPKLRAQFRVLGRVPGPKQGAQNTQGAEVEYIEWAPDYIAELAAASVVILPDRNGSGIKNRFLQCLALGCAVIAAPAATEGVQVRTGQEFIGVDSAADMASALEELLKSESKRLALASHARTTARRLFHPTETLTAWVNAYSGGMHG